MLINDKKLKELNKLLNDIDNVKEERIETDKRIAKIRIDLQRMSRERMSIERSKNENRIGHFNKKFIKLLSEISRLTQTTGTTCRDKVAQIVREIKQK